jgi:hypothetical protein
MPPDPPLVVHTRTPAPAPPVAAAHCWACGEADQWADALKGEATTPRHISRRIAYLLRVCRAGRAAKRHEPAPGAKRRTSGKRVVRRNP